jgi:hypothetical protein
MADHKKKVRALPKQDFQVGAEVEFEYSIYPAVRGVIVEDRGPLDVGGRKLWGVEFQFDQLKPAYIELGEDEMTLVQGASNNVVSRRPAG